MVSRCANEDCGAPFHYLREGRVFKFEVPSRSPEHATTREPTLVTSKRVPAAVEHFWLCGKCSTRMTLGYDQEKGVIMIPFQQRAHRAVAS